MGKPRKDQPGYVRGVDRRGHVTWRTDPNTAAPPPVAPPVDIDYRSVGGFQLPALVGTAWEAASPNIATDLSGQDLSGLLIEGVNLRTATLNGADLSSAIIIKSDLSAADLRGVHGENMSLEHTYLSHAVFDGSDLKYFDLHHTSSAETDFSNTLMREAQISKSKLYLVRFQYADMSYSKFDGVGGEELDFSYADLTGSVFGSSTPMSRYEVMLADCVFHKADLRDVVFDGVLLEGGDFTGARFNGADLTGLYLPDHSVTSCRVILTGSNITSGQVADLLYSNPAYCANQLVYERHSFDDLQSRTGWDNAETMVQIWTGAVEVRDNETQQLVTGQYDRNRHHIPQWALRASGASNR